MSDFGVIYRAHFTFADFCRRRPRPRRLPFVEKAPPSHPLSHLRSKGRGFVPLCVSAVSCSQFATCSVGSPSLLVAARRLVHRWRILVSHVRRRFALLV